MEDPEPFPPGGRSYVNHPPPANWFDTVDRNVNTQLTYKGLRNAPGENNCFLNSAVQVFWHLDVFRRSYRRLTGHLCMGNSCIFCALKVIFTQFQYSDQSSLPPDALRKALAETFMNQQRFQLGHMDDAAECFENILRRIHFHIANAYHEDSCSAAHCLPHQKFAMTVFDQLVCVCGASSEPLKFHEMVHYINTNALVSQYRSMQETGDILHPDRFGLLLRNGGAAGDIRDCPGNCGKRVQIRRTLINSPDVVSIGLVWDSDRPSGDLINDVARSIGTSILLQDVFHSVMSKDVPKLQLSALVCYYGKHYSTFVYHTKLNVWIYFDDATVKEIGPRWEHVVEKCSRGRYQPLLLLYTNPNANPICTDTAPKKRVMAPGFGTPSKGSVDNEKKLDLKSVGDIPSSRNHPTLVPTSPDLSSPDTDGPKSAGSDHRRQPSFLIAITGKNGRGVPKSEYAVPSVNAPIKQMLPGGQGQFQGRPDQMSRQGSQRSPTSIQQDVIAEDVVDGYNYTLSTSDQYRRPSLNSVDSNKNPVAFNFTRTAETQRKESFKKNKGNGRIAADVVRYQMDPRRNSSSDSDSPISLDGAMMPPQLPPKRGIVHSHSFEESPANLSADNIDVRQHVVLKPKPSPGHVYENIENLSHTPVQSGLATLPRNKSKAGGHQHSRQGSVNQESNQGSHSRQSSTNTLTESHSRQSSTHTLTDHSRQNSSVSQHTEIIQQAHHNVYSHPALSVTSYNRQVSAPTTPGTSRKAATGEPQKKEKPPKPAKPEKKSSLSAKKKAGQTQPEQQQQQPPPLPDKKKPRSPNGESYIDRKMVESVLKYQTKLSRQGSTNSSVSQSSNTSFDSDNFSMKSGKDGHVSDNASDTVSLESHRDSGYGSSDRNSSSSTGSTTLDPYTQYFLSKSMIPPKSINPQALAENMRKIMNPKYPTGEHTVMSQYGSQYNYQSSANEHGPSSDKYGPNVYHGPEGKPFNPVVDGFGNPIEPASSETRKQLYDPAIVKSHQSQDGRMNQVPSRSSPSNGLQPNYSGQSNNGPSEPTSTGATVVNEQFRQLCQQSEDVMDSCVLAETDENYPSAINYCNASIDLLKQAMKLPNLPQQCFTYGQKKHNSCLLKLRSLQKKSAILRQESNSSTTSSDSARSSPMTITSSHPGSCHNHHVSSKLAEPCVHHNVTALQQNAVHSRSSSRDSVDSVIENKNYRPDRPSSASSNSSQKQVTALSSSSSSQSTVHERTLSNNSNNVDIYGTLPRKHSRKPPAAKSPGTSNTHEGEGYRDFANRQRSSNTGNSSPMLEKQSSDSTMESQFQMPAQQHIRSNVAEIRPLQQSGNVQQHPATQQRNSNPHGNVPTENLQTFHGNQSEPSTRSSSRPTTPQPAESANQETDYRPSVRDLASRFGGVRHRQGLEQPFSCSQDRNNSSVPLEFPPQAGSLQNRQRSKSESDFRNMQESKPKSVLSKNKKNRGSKPRKSVTFCDSIALISAADLDLGLAAADPEMHAGYVSDEEDRYAFSRGAYSDNELEEGDSSDSPVEIFAGEEACNLCGKKGVIQGQTYCSKCFQYMNRFQQRR